MRKTVGIISLGCPRNLVDSEAMLGELVRAGFNVSERIDNAEIAIVNTCAFIKEAKVESIDTILEIAKLKKEGLLNTLIVTGCLPQRYGKELKDELNEADVLMGTDAARYIVKIIDELGCRESRIDGITEKKFYISKCPNTLMPLLSTYRYHLTPPHYAYIKVSEGCPNTCTYCVIPKLRGIYNSRRIDSIVAEVKMLAKQRRTKEINLIGQDTTSYGIDIYHQLELAKLLKKLAKVEDIRWIRLLYTHPAHIEDDLIVTIADEQKICRYIDLPLQHINDEILTKMGRKTTKSDILKLIRKFRNSIPDLAIRTAFIVGFPGETDEQFEELLDFIRQVKFERLGVFTYSKEEGTPAFNFPDHISEKVKQKRFQEIMSLQQAISKKVNESFLGKEVEVLIDEISETENNIFMGRTQWDAPEVDGVVWVKSNRRLEGGDFLKVKVVDTYEYDLVGEDVLNYND